MISCLLNVGKIWNSAQINWSSTLNFYREYFFRRNNIHREIDRWSRHRFGAKWNVTVPNSVMPVKPLVCKWICTCHRVMLSIDTQITRILNFHPHYRETVILSNFYEFITKNAVFFLLFKTTRVKSITWNQYISVNVHVAQILIKQIYPLNERCDMGTVISLGDRNNQLSAQIDSLNLISLPVVSYQIDLDTGHLDSSGCW